MIVIDAFHDIDQYDVYRVEDGTDRVIWVEGEKVSEFVTHRVLHPNLKRVLIDSGVLNDSGTGDNTD